MKQPVYTVKIFGESNSSLHFVSSLMYFFFFYCRKLKKKRERFCKAISKRLHNYQDCQKLIGGLPGYRSLYDGGDLYAFTNNDSLIDWNYINNSLNSTATDWITNQTLIPTQQNEQLIQPVLPPFELWQTIFIAICLAICIILTVGGNILVLLAFIVDRSIRQPSNYFIASLAATDMLIGKLFNFFFLIFIHKSFILLFPTTI